MRWMKYSIYILSVLVVTGCHSIREASVDSQLHDSALNEAQYYKMFIDATKYSLINNQKTAVGLYNACISLYPDRAAPYFQLSSIYLTNQQVNTAKDYARKAAVRDSSNIWYLTQLANIYQYLEMIDSAIVFYDKAYQISNKQEIAYNLAILYSKVDNYNKSLEMIGDLESNLPGSREILMLKHNVFHNMRDYDSAIDELEKVIYYFPDDPGAYGMLAEYLTEIGRNEYALRIYRKMERENPDNGLILLSFAEYYARNRKIDSAFVYYNRALCCSNLDYDTKMDVAVNFIVQNDFMDKHQKLVISLLDTIPREDHDHRLYAAYADLFINRENYDLAKVYIDSALIFDKSSYVLWEQALIVNNTLGDHQEVIRIASEGVSYFPDRPNLFYIRALSHYTINEYSEALKDLNSVYQLNAPERMVVQAMNIEAEIYRVEENYIKSDSIYEAIIEIQPENLIIRNNYAYYLSLREEKLDLALSLSKLTIETEPNNATYLDTYGWILFKQGNYLKAKKFIESAIRNGAFNNAEVLDHYGMIMYYLENCEEAIEAWERVKETDSSYPLPEEYHTAKSICE